MDQNHSFNHNSQPQAPQPDSSQGNQYPFTPPPQQQTYPQQQSFTPQPATPPGPPSQKPHDRSATLNVVEKAEQLIIFVYFFIASILFFRFILSLFGANISSPFVDFVYQLTQPFMLPFSGMFGRSPGIGTHRLEFEVLVALIVYALIMFGISRLVRIIFR